MESSNAGNIPLVSVIIPVFNCEKYLAQAIDSVFSQSYPNFELIIVDDGSEDRSREIALSYPGIRYFSQENSGVASARNLGIKEARGEYIAFLDSDDLWVPEKLSLQMAELVVDPSLEMVTGHVEQFISPELDKDVTQKYRFVRTPLAGFSTSSILLRRSVLEKTGLFHEDYHDSETISWFANAVDREVQLFILPDIVARRRIHGNNISLTNNENQKTTVIRILRKSIERKRARDNAVKGFKGNGT